MDVENIRHFFSMIRSYLSAITSLRKAWYWFGVGDTKFSSFRATTPVKREEKVISISSIKSWSFVHQSTDLFTMKTNFRFVDSSISSSADHSAPIEQVFRANFPLADMFLHESKRTDPMDFIEHISHRDVLTWKGFFTSLIPSFVGRVWLDRAGSELVITGPLATRSREDYWIWEPTDDWLLETKSCHRMHSFNGRKKNSLLRTNKL